MFVDASRDVVSARVRFGAMAALACLAACAGTRPSATGGGKGGSASSSSGAGGATDGGGVFFARYDGPAPSYDASMDAPMRVVGSAPLGDAACAAQTQMAEKIPLDMYVMLDTSSSMSDPVGTTTTSKWTAIRNALTTFMRDPNSSGIGVGLQYFPLETPNVPDQCDVDTDCGASGPCDVNKICEGGLNVVFCTTNADCGANGPCVRLGLCSLNPTIACTAFGTACTSRRDICTELAGYCHGRDMCTPGSYATPAVEVAPLPGAATALTASLTAHMPDGLTPTAGALAGAISHAQALAKANAGHRVVVLLATDGLPDECTPIDNAGLASIAASGLAGAPSIATFTIGVFGAPDQQMGQTTLDAIAAAGGTKQSFVISSQQSNVEQVFLTALNSIRTAALSCQFKVPTPTMGQTLDYYAVNVQFTSGAGQTVTIGNVHDKTACDPRQGGWYYDVDPAKGTPQNISICDTSCTQLRGDPAGRVDVLVGCKTEIIIP
jgi:hypothetical protein